ncbi:hypothetical protein HDU81_004209 [Chytriomyces hyalinus]|nr:hypothetical protein HDU81_004209 [Chytriomyces hyalinus]
MALPYIDKDLDSADARDYVDNLIREEMRSMSGSKPSVGQDVSLFENSPALKSLLASVSNGVSTSAIDTSRFRLEPPPASEKHSEEAWKTAVDNAHAQLEHQQNRLLNLELLNAYGANAWRVSNFQVEAAVKLVTAKVEERKAAVLEINKERKIEQTKAGTELQALEQRWRDLVDQCLRIDIANQVLQAEIDELRGTA